MKYLYIIILFILSCTILHGQNPGMVADINSGTEGSWPYNLTVFNNKLFFCTNDFIHGYECWSLDGSGVPFLAADIWPGSQISRIRSLTATDTRLFLVDDSYRIADSLYSADLWVYDGTNDPSMVAENFHGRDLTPINNKLLYYYSDQLWEYDLSQPEPIPVCLTAGGELPEPWGGNPAPPIVFNQKFYFPYCDSIHGCELWEYDGTNSPELTSDIWPGYIPVNERASSKPQSFILYNEKLYFSARYDYVLQIWEYDGLNPPAMVTNITPDTMEYSRNIPLAVFDGKLYFAGDNGISGVELWEYNGMDPPAQVADINPGKEDSNPGGDPHFISSRSITCYNQKLYFSASDGIHGRELWEYNGEDPPAQVADICPGPNGSDPRYLVVLNDRLYFQADDGIHGAELWSLFLTGTGEGKIERVYSSTPIPMLWYPNPVENNLYIEFESQFSGNMRIVDLKGNVLSKRRISQCQNTSINFTGFIPGQYQVIIQTGKLSRIIRVVRIK